MQDWLKESESVGRRIVDSDHCVASTERITKPGSPDWAVTLHGDREVTAEITCMTEPGMNLKRGRLVIGKEHSPKGRWYLDVRGYSNDPPSPKDDEPVKKALLKIISPAAPVAAARLEDRRGGAAEMREWQQSHQWEEPPWHDEAQALCDAVLRKCVTEFPGSQPRAPAMRSGCE